MRKRDLTHLGISWNPFSPEVPVEALVKTQKTRYFCWRVEQQLQEGGFIQLVGEPGTGKSVMLRQLNEHLKQLPDVTTGVLSMPQSKIGSFYREIGYLFGVHMTPANRFGGFKALRDRWLAHIDTTLYRPVLIYDEAQLALSQVLSELRLLTSANFDSQNILTVVLCGDSRLPARLQTEELLPLKSRIRFTMNTEPVKVEDMKLFIEHCLEAAGNPRLISESVIHALAEHSCGNYRVLTNAGNELLRAAIRKETAEINEQLFLEAFNVSISKTTGRRKKG